MLGKVGLNITLADVEIKTSLKKAEEVKDELLTSSVAVKEIELNAIKDRKEQTQPVATSYRALWIIDEKNNVLIRIEDDKGNVVKQIPPEEIVNLREKMNELMKNFFKIEA
ncbi:MAG: hypothetical protein OHK0040_13610 [bacterium]